MKKIKDHTEKLFFLIGLVFVIESLFFALLLNAAAPIMTQTGVILGWIYGIIKFVAGIVAIYVSLKK